MDWPKKGLVVAFTWDKPRLGLPPGKKLPGVKPPAPGKKPVKPGKAIESPLVWN
jgi:hypothetical protein